MHLVHALVLAVVILDPYALCIVWAHGDVFLRLICNGNDNDNNIVTVPRVWLAMIVPRLSINNSGRGQGMTLCTHVVTKKLDIPAV